MWGRTAVSSVISCVGKKLEESQRRLQCWDLRRTLSDAPKVQIHISRSDRFIRRLGRSATRVTGRPTHGRLHTQKNKDASKAMARELEVNPNAVATLLSATQLVIGRPEVRLSQRHATCVRTILHGIPPIRLPPSRPAEAA